MDNINGLPDDLLVKILSFVPTYVAVSTCVLSKRWEFLWMWLPNLEFVSPWDSRPGIVDFINKKLPIHRAPVIERLCIHINSNPHIKPEYIKRWIEIAVSHYVRELQIDYHSKTEITLQLEAESYFIDGKYLQQLISGCPVLEDLSLRFCCNDNLREFTVIIPSLQNDERNDIVCWNQPSSVLECLLSSLKILNWSAYFGRPQDRDIAVYILKNACHLKTATFLTDKRINDVRRLKMIKELRLSPRASSICQLVFGEDF
ncbi:unnamed protein product [Arabidopsis thaliana]|uniref:FBD domain-containing protein n=1 Tax=Arabidopsis thaliana TaxID=3702 RepID=A0A5S9Y9G5_ARATH|nr:unnamed protein product [Arabidopsis thaliana]